MAVLVSENKVVENVKIMLENIDFHNFISIFDSNPLNYGKKRVERFHIWSNSKLEFAVIVHSDFIAMHRSTFANAIGFRNNIARCEYLCA